MGQTGARVPISSLLMLTAFMQFKCILSKGGLCRKGAVREEGSMGVPLLGTQKSQGCKPKLFSNVSAHSLTIYLFHNYSFD